MLRREKKFILDVSPIKTDGCPLIMTVELGILWGCDGTVLKQGELLRAEFDDGKIFAVSSNGTNINFPYAFSSSPYNAFILDKPVLCQIQNIMRMRQKHYLP